VIYSHWSHVPWDEHRWPNFMPWEFSSPDNGQIYWFPEFFDKMQAVRFALGKPIKLNSAHRSWRHNLRVGGAPRSQHKKQAGDISLIGHNRFEVLAACRGAGFTGFGYAQTFLHVDLGRKRFWYYGPHSKKAWRV